MFSIMCNTIRLQCKSIHIRGTTIFYKTLPPMFCTLLFNHQYNKLYKTFAEYSGLSYVKLMEILQCTICTVDQTVLSTLHQLAVRLVLITVLVVQCWVNYSNAATTLMCFFWLIITDSKNIAFKVMTINRCAINSFMKLDQKDGHILVTMQTKQ